MIHTALGAPLASPRLRCRRRVGDLLKVTYKDNA